MLNKLIKTAIYNKGLTFTLTLVAIFAGWMSFQTLPIDAVPDITNVQVQVNTAVEGLIPEEIEISFDNLQSERGIYYFEFNPQGYSKAARLRLEDKSESILEIVCRSPAENYEIVKIVGGREYDI